MEQTAPVAPAPAAPARPGRRRMLFGILIVFMLVAAIGGGWYLYQSSKYVTTEKADIEAPLIKLGPQAGGILMNVSVKQGDVLRTGQTVARIGDEIIHAQVDGLAIIVENNVGEAYAPGQAVVTMIEPKELHVMARIQEDKGLKDVYVGQKAFFTVDAYGSEQFEGTVESISATKREGDVVFNISDKRQEQEFDVKIAYDHKMYRDFQNGMSARVWIVK
jgi:multidrug resistance efflux pump